MNSPLVLNLPEPVPGGSTLRILVVDDNRGEFLLLESSFTGIGAEVELITATTGHLAIAGLLATDAEQLPHLALVDIGMPLISGFAVARQLIGQGIPTIMMSTMATPERHAETRTIGALGLLAKPNDTAGYGRLATRILELARRQGGTQ